MGTSVGYVTDEEEDDDEEELSEESGICCAECGSDLKLTEEIFLLRVVQPVRSPSGVQNVDILNQDEDYLYAPTFFCFDCWEELQEELQESMEDIPPVMDVGGIIECDICRSDILPEETMVVADFGELHWSERNPSGAYTIKFVEMQKDVHVCVSCARNMEESRSTPIWELEINPKPGLQVCAEGLFERCWRYGNCKCHKALSGE